MMTPMTNIFQVETVNHQPDIVGGVIRYTRSRKNCFDRSNGDITGI